MIIFIGCGKRKNSYKCPAKMMYQGNFFKTCLSYAKTLTVENNIYILSAKYGVLNLTDIIEPYDKTLNNMDRQEKAQWSKMVKHQLQEKNLLGKEAMFLCGKNYYISILDNFSRALIPLAGLSGMGYQIQWMKNKMKRRLF
jgi:cytoplasmic iron level regulating protein YaaA (DUF328/UPF0246 family)|nr:MAG TPA: YaaA [Caudoviricetes sp.]